MQTHNTVVVILIPQCVEKHAIGEGGNGKSPHKIHFSRKNSESCLWLLLSLKSSMQSTKSCIDQCIYTNSVERPSSVYHRTLSEYIYTYKDSILLLSCSVHLVAVETQGKKTQQIFSFAAQSLLVTSQLIPLRYFSMVMLKFNLDQSVFSYFQHSSKLRA